MLAFSGVHSRRICVPIHSLVRIDVTSRGAEEGQSVSGRKLRAEKRKTTVHGTYAGRRSDGGSRGRLRFRSVSRQASDVSILVIDSVKIAHAHGGALVLRRAALPDTERKRERERSMADECTRENDAPNWRNGPCRLRDLSPGNDGLQLRVKSYLSRELRYRVESTRSARSRNSSSHGTIHGVLKRRLKISSVSRG